MARKKNVPPAPAATEASSGAGQGSPRRAGRRIALTACGVVAGVLGAATLSGVATGVSTTTTERIAGDDRYATAATIATKTFQSSAFAVLATGTAFPDAISASAVAGDLTAPVLLVRPDSVPQPTADTLQALGVKSVVIMGGPEAVSPAVEAALTERYQVSRVAGADRFATAAAAARRVGSARIGSIDGGPSAFLATGLEFADAVSGSSGSYFGLNPVLLTRPDVLPPDTALAVTELGVSRVVLLGGTDAISPSVEAALQATGVTTERVGGINRSDTAAKLADFFMETFGYDATHVNLATGRDFADALAGGPHAGDVEGAPVLLAESATSLGSETEAWLRAHCPTIATIHAFGGADAVSDAVVQTAEQAAKAC